MRSARRKTTSCRGTPPGASPSFWAARALRAGFQRPHRRDHQPAGGQGHLLDQRPGRLPPTRSNGSRWRPPRRELVDGLDAPGSPSAPAARSSRRRWAAPPIRRWRMRRAVTCWRSNEKRQRPRPTCIGWAGDRPSRFNSLPRRSRPPNRRCDAPANSQPVCSIMECPMSGKNVASVPSAQAVACT